MSFNTNQLSDEDLVKRYKSKQDKTAIGELFKRHSLMCFSVCYNYLKDEEFAKDASMSIFEKLFSDLTKHQIENFRSWLHTVSRNYCLMQLRKQDMKLSKTMLHLDQSQNFMELESLEHLDISEKEKQLQRLEKAILELKDKQQVCIRLFYIEQKSYEEITEITGYSTNEVKSHIQNGKRNLKIRLGSIEFILWLLLIWKL